MNNSNTNINILIWVSTLTLMVLLIIIIGGLTRLTNSGLSMVDWRPIMGVLPPFSNQSWMEVFNNYKLTPEFKIVNSNMTLAEFKFIFWWEWFHRLFARLIGIAFFFPFLYFYFKKQLTINFIITILFAFLLVFIQALVGWWMVKSGLADDPYVSPYRLTFHLFNALVIFCILFWLTLNLIFGSQKIHHSYNLINFLFQFAFILVFLTIISGGFMAGTDAGKSFNTFPLMGEKFIPEGYYLSDYRWRNFFENTIAINFNHRWIAMFTFIFILIVNIFLFKSKNYINRTPLYLLLLILFFQILLGILTLIYEVPLILAILHQTNATFLLAATLFAYHRLIYK